MEPNRHQKKARKLFSPEEDATLTRIMFENPFTSWINVAAQMPGRTARQCRDRWSNYLSPENKNLPWTAEEDALLIEKFRTMGPQWTNIAKCFDGRSENNVKNRWYTHLRHRFEKPVVIQPQPQRVHPTPMATIAQAMPPKLISSTPAPHVILPPITTIASDIPLRQLPPIPSIPGFNVSRLKSCSVQPTPRLLFPWVAEDQK